jgi:hypothetical protein
MGFPDAERQISRLMKGNRVTEKQKQQHQPQILTSISQSLADDDDVRTVLVSQPVITVIVVCESVEMECESRNL